MKASLVDTNVCTRGQDRRSSGMIFPDYQTQQMGNGSPDVVIIGAGLAGCAMALSLHQHSIPVRIYESRSPADPEISSGVILTPNGLRVLDKLDVYDRIKEVCWIAEYRTYKNDKDETTRKVRVTGPDLYGYANHRIWRRTLLAEMKALLFEKKIPIHYNSRFEGVLCESKEDGVTFEINGKEEKTTLIIGADGIYSSVRKHLNPHVAPEYTGVVGIISHINRDTVDWPHEDFEKQCTIQGKPGALVLMPEIRDGSEIMVAIQAKYPDQSRTGFEAMAKNSQFMTDFFRRDYNEWHDTGKKIIDSVCEHQETLYLWPYLRIPKMEQWYSSGGRVIIVGDAAHALPPSSGQGVNQALEDVWTLSMLLASSKNLQQALSFWQEMRQQRINAVFDWATNATNVQRMPEAERLKILQTRQMTNSKVVDSFDDMRWLYQPDTEQKIAAWIEDTST